MLKLDLGTVISSVEGPSPTNFSFVVKENGTSVKRGQFVELDTAEGLLIGRVSDVRKANRYFEREESVREYEKKGSSMESIFPVDKWEFTVGVVKPLGVYVEGKKMMLKPSFPPSPGSKVRLASDDFLKQFLGIDNEGLYLGSIEHHDVDVKLNLTNLLQKHFAILAMSGAGKSYLTSVVIEELLDRNKEQGRVGIVMIDVHGEYTNFAEPVKAGSDKKDYSKLCKVLNGSNIKIGVPNLSGGQICRLIGGLSSVQTRDLKNKIRQIQKKFRKGGGTYNLIDIVKEVERSDKMKSSTKDALKNWIFSLNATGVFSDVDYPSVKTIVKPGKMSIIDLSSIISNKKKQIITSYIVNELFKMRRNGDIPPFLLIVEEAHQFVPEGVSSDYALARSIIETIAREGRKFHASLCLISQRPKRLSTTVLSQCNTHVIMRITNPYDLDHIKASSEGITSDTLDAISSLPVGEGLIVGEAVNYPVFVKIRERNSQSSAKSKGLEDAAIEFESKNDKKNEDAESFM
ncbi:MAG: ATP-binding protein [Candidatus Undinarchaeales archaeon]